MEAAMTKKVMMGATAALMAFSALQAPGALAKDGRGDGHSHDWKGSKYRHFRIGHDGDSRGSDHGKGYKYRHFRIGRDGDSRGSDSGKGSKYRHVHSGDDGDSRGSYFWKWRNTGSPFWYRRDRSSAGD
jgi:hypothetical protein